MTLAAFKREPTSIVDLVLRLIVAHRAVRDVCARQWLSFPPEYQFLFLIDGRTRLKQVVQDGHFSKQQASALLKLLIGRNLIETEPDPDDARGIVLTLTQDGKRDRWDVAKQFLTAIGWAKTRKLKSLCASIEEATDLLVELAKSKPANGGKMVLYKRKASRQKTGRRS